MAAKKGTKLARRLPARLMVDDEIELRAFTDRDADRLFALVEANRRYLRPWMGWVDRTRSPEDIRKFIGRCRAQVREGSGFQTGIWRRGDLVGTVGFNRIDWPDGKAEIGYWLAEDLQGQGIVTRSCRALIDLAFNRLDLNRVEIRAAPANRRSRAVPRRLGFTREGILRESERVNERFEDSVVYGLLRRERRARSPRGRRSVYKADARSRGRRE